MPPIDHETLKDIKNKHKRQDLFTKLKYENNKQRHKERASRARAEQDNPELKEKRLAENVPDTIDSKRVYDETIITEHEGEDEFDQYFKEGVEPKVLITTSANSHRPSYEFAATLLEIFPNSQFVKRQRKYKISDMAEYCANRDFTDLIVVNEDKKVVNGLTFVHLPNGPSFYFSVKSLVERKRIKGHGQSTGHIPELILNNFSTRLGLTVSRLFQSLLPHKPEFEGRQVVTLHNQRDYIFFRMHRYVFRNEEKVGLQELGPQFTLKLRRVMKGIRGEVDWEYKPEMEKDKRKFYL
ncbi:rRNA-binding ribosome biosynthesis protein [Martiniozyma asiatica (nom. inval.)]|nr:rRNA-binding ribosome biosynthesis protein [Martiniozyma asiatica]